MSKEIIETLFSKYNKYEIVKDSSALGGVKFYLQRDGSPYGAFSDLRDAIEKAKKEGAK
jgi:hypothetical protein